MLRGNLSNQDEGEVEDELEALQRELGPKIPEPEHEHEPVLPNAPTEALKGKEPEQEPEPSEEAQAKAKARTPVLAS